MRLTDVIVNGDRMTVELLQQYQRQNELKHGQATGWKKVLQKRSQRPPEKAW